jgi:hypothetical protein
VWTQTLSKDCLIDQASGNTAAGTTTVTGSTFDMLDFDGVVAIASLYSAVNGSVVGLQIQTGAQSNGSDAALPTNGANATYTFGASPSAGVVVSEEYRPQLRYVTPVLTRTTQNVACGGIVLIRYRGRVNPVTQGSTNLASTVVAGV